VLPEPKLLLNKKNVFLQLHGHSGVLSSRQAAGLSRKIKNHDPNLQPVGLAGNLTILKMPYRAFII